MLFDCAVVGGGPAGLNAALVLGRAKRPVILFDNNRPRNAVTHESHGFITRDGISPGDFRRAAHSDLEKYPSIQFKSVKIVEMAEERGVFRLTAENGASVHAKKVILATGLKESLPAIPRIMDYYGTSLFNCPYCDGWELRDRPLVVISDSKHADHLAMMVHNWSKDLVVCTNGTRLMSEGQIALLRRNGIPVYDSPIRELEGEGGRLESLLLASGELIKRSGGFVTVRWEQAAPFGSQFGCVTNAAGGFVTDAYGRTSVPGIYAAGDTSVIAPAQLIIAAAEGSRAAMGVNLDLIAEAWKA